MSIKKSLIVLIVSVITLIFSVLYTRRHYSIEHEVTLQKIQEELEHYDNWAVFYADGNLLSESCQNEFSDYVEKMLEEAQNSDVNINVISTHGLNIYLEVCDPLQSYEWLNRNSWKFGFISHGGDGGFRYVGVFPAEQMYYSGLELKKYINLIQALED